MKKLYKEKDLQPELCVLLNRYCQENNADTPDFVLAEYLLDALKVYNKAVKRRDEWWGVKMSINGVTANKSIPLVKKNGRRKN